MFVQLKVLDTEVQVSKANQGETHFSCVRLRPWSETTCWDGSISNPSLWDSTVCCWDLPPDGDVGTGRQGWVWGSTGAYSETIISLSVTEKIILPARVMAKVYRKATGWWMGENELWDQLRLLAQVSFNQFWPALNLGLHQRSCWEESSHQWAQFLSLSRAFTGLGDRWGNKASLQMTASSFTHGLKKEESFALLFCAHQKLCCARDCTNWPGDRHRFAEGKEERFSLLMHTSVIAATSTHQHGQKGLFHLAAAPRSERKLWRLLAGRKNSRLESK